MNRSARVLVLVLAMAAAALIVALPKAPFVALTPSQAGGLATFAFLALFSEGLATSFGAGPARQVASSISFIPLFACALVFPPILVLMTVLMVAAGMQLLRRSRNSWVRTFNLAQYSLAYVTGAIVYHTLAGPSISSGHIYFLPFVGMAVTFFALNVGLVTAFMALRSSASWLSLILKAIGPGGGNLLYDILASPLAVFAALVYLKFSAAWLILVALPLFLVRYSYTSKLQLERVNKDLLFVLVKAIETRDAYTSGHSIRVAALARAIAQDLGFRRKALENLETAALLHDIGKIEALYAPVISKPYELSSEERALIRTHALKGAEILLNLSAFSEDVIRAVRHHHEWYDGSGYPEGLQGEEIPVTARIIMACDAIDAMLSDRPYRNALPVPAVESELRRCSGTQFDPKLIAIILQRGTLNRIAAERTPLSAPTLTLVAGAR